MNKKLLLSILVFITAITASAATKYEINIAGVEVTSDNASHITGGDITSGYGVYNASTNTLTLYNLKINRSGSQDEYGIHNRKCDNLTIVFNGSCSVMTSDNALKLERSTTLTAAAGSSTTFYSAARICANLKSYAYNIKGTGTFHFLSAQSGYEAIKGEGSVQGKTYVNFQGAKVIAHSTNRTAVKSLNAYFYSGAHLEIESNGSNASVDDVTMIFNGKVAVVSPYQAVYNANAKSVVIGSSPVTDKKIIITDDYVAILNSTYFPDQNFRNALYNSYYSKGYINSTDVANRKELNLYGKDINNLTGIGYFTSLTNLDCSCNYLTSLTSLPTSVTYLECYSNLLTSLSVPSGLTYLDCRYNQLTSLPTMPGTIKKIYAAGNKFSGTLSVTGKSQLVTLDVSNNTSLTTLNCYNNLLTTLNYSGCTALTSLNCSGNGLTTLPTLPSGLTYLDCSSNQLTSLPVLPNNIDALLCGANKFNTLTIAGNSKLKTLNVKNNTMLTTLNCYANALTALDYSGCSALKTLDCANNKLTSLAAVPSSVTKFNCSANQLQSMPSLPSGLRELECAVNKLSSLSVQGLNSLSRLVIYTNQIKESAMGTLVNSLRTIPAGSTGTFLVLGGSGEGNVITSAQVNTARSKRWYPKQDVNGNWEDIPGIVPGDVNGDGYVTSADVTAVYDVMLGTDLTFQSTADVNGDGYVTSADVTMVYDIMLGN